MENNKIIRAKNSYLDLNVTVRSIKIVRLKVIEKLITQTLSVFEDFVGRKNGLNIKNVELNLSLTICGEQLIRKLNRDYRNKDKKTDVLSFPVHESLLPENHFQVMIPCLNLGDIFICYQVTEAQAKLYQVTFENEFVRLLVHGLLHLCGYDHEISAKDEQIMRLKEQKIIKKIFQMTI